MSILVNKHIKVTTHGMTGEIGTLRDAAVKELLVACKAIEPSLA